MDPGNGPHRTPVTEPISLEIQELTLQGCVRVHTTVVREEGPPAPGGDRGEGGSRSSGEGAPPQRQREE